MRMTISKALGMRCPVSCMGREMLAVSCSRDSIKLKSFAYGQSDLHFCKFSKLEVVSHEVSSYGMGREPIKKDKPVF